MKRRVSRPARPRKAATTASRRRPPGRTKSKPRATSVAKNRAVKKKASSPRHRRTIAAPFDSGLAPGMQAINMYLAVANVEASMAFLERVFGFTRGVVLPASDGPPRYAEMRHGDSVVMLVRKGDHSTATAGMSALYTYVPDVDRVAAEAREAGASVHDPEDRPWGDRAAVITDPDGFRWVLATFKKLPAF